MRRLVVAVHHHHHHLYNNKCWGPKKLAGWLNALPHLHSHPSLQITTALVQQTAQLHHTDAKRKERERRLNRTSHAIVVLLCSIIQFIICGCMANWCSFDQNPAMQLLGKPTVYQAHRPIFPSPKPKINTKLQTMLTLSSRSQGSLSIWLVSSRTLDSSSWLMASRSLTFDGNQWLSVLGNAFNEGRQRRISLRSMQGLNNELAADGASCRRCALKLSASTGRVVDEEDEAGGADEISSTKQEVFVLKKPVGSKALRSFWFQSWDSGGGFLSFFLLLIGSGVRLAKVSNSVNQFRLMLHVMSKNYESIFIHALLFIQHSHLLQLHIELSQRISTISRAKS